MRFVTCSKADLPPPTGKRVMVIGAGPAGLAAAGFLVCRGHEVTVVDMLPEPGGMMVFAIPDFRFDKSRVVAGIKELEDPVSYTHLTLPTTERV